MGSRVGPDEPSYIDHSQAAADYFPALRDLHGCTNNRLRRVLQAGRAWSFSGGDHSRAQLSHFKHDDGHLATVRCFQHLDAR